MASRIRKHCSPAALALALTAFIALASPARAHAPDPEDDRRFVQVAASTKEQRTQLATAGMSIEATRSDSVWGFVDPATLKDVRKLGYKIMGDFELSVARGGHDNLFGFPTKDERFHDYRELTEALQQLEARNPDIARVHSIGKSIEGRDLWALHINTSAEDLKAGKSSKPGAIFMGNHHAREHLSVEIPLMLAQHLLDNRADAEISKLLESRDLWIIPMVNPDGAEYDIATGKYRMWRKNRRANAGGTFGVDLNRNYAYGWGTGGSSDKPSSDVYMGTEPFSEPESQAIRDFVGAHLNARTLLTFHTFSELILYPWGGKYDPITNVRDRATFETMAKTMAKWNGYVPQPASDLYIASGDTVDWAYGTHGIFAFTFELSPRDMFDGGFYPGAKIIDRVFKDNLKPCLYMIDLADDPHRAQNGGGASSFLRNYVEPSTDFAGLGLPRY
jgi:carboxypeptidase T